MTDFTKLSPEDLARVTTRVYYANVYPVGVYSDYPNIEDARANRGSSWLALYKITDDGVNATIEVIERNKGA